MHLAFEAARLGISPKNMLCLNRGRMLRSLSFVAMAIYGKYKLIRIAKKQDSGGRIQNIDRGRAAQTDDVSIHSP
jgi:hypothetical protein